MTFVSARLRSKSLSSRMRLFFIFFSFVNKMK